MNEALNHFVFISSLQVALNSAIYFIKKKQISDNQMQKDNIISEKEKNKTEEEDQEKTVVIESAPLVEKEKNPYQLQVEELQETKQKLRTIESEMEAFNNPSTFAKYSQMQRETIKLNNLIEKLNKEASELAKLHPISNTENKRFPQLLENSPNLNGNSNSNNSNSNSSSTALGGGGGIQAQKQGPIHEILLQIDQYFTAILVVFYWKSVIKVDFDMAYLYPIDVLFGSYTSDGEYRLHLWIWTIACIRITNVVQLLFNQNQKVF